MFELVEYLKMKTREKDLIDIMHLRVARDQECDARFKTCTWNISQNEDRQGNTRIQSICCCYTPKGMVYVSNRGRPVTGLEAQAIQGIEH